MPFETVVFVDIPDPDNIFMILYVLAVSTGRVAIVLSPRILDLSVVRYGDEFSKMKKKLGFRFLFDPITKKPTNIPKEWEKFFEPDGTLSDSEVQHDTILYMRVSKKRVEECIEAQFQKRKEYEIFWDPKSMKNIKKPDMRHALHVADYAFNFNSKERERYERILKEHTESGPELRNALRGICKSYITRIARKTNSDPDPTDFQCLLKANNTVEGAKLVIGGPLTEALLYVRQTEGKPSSVAAMLGTLTKDRNAAGVQFNIGKDPESADGFLTKVKEKWISMIIVPTECCKGKDEKDPSQYALSYKQSQQLLKTNSALSYKMVQRYMKETGHVTHYSPFDWITAIADRKRDLFHGWVPVTHKPCRLGGSVTDVEFTQTTESSPIVMAIPDAVYMGQKIQRLHEEMRRTFEIRRHRSAED